MCGELLVPGGRQSCLWLELGGPSGVTSGPGLEWGEAG